VAQLPASRRCARRPAVRPAAAPPGHPPGRAAADRRQRQHRRGARGLLPAHHAHRQPGHAPAADLDSGLFESGFWGFTLAPQALLPIFDAGRNQANLALRQAGRDIAVAQYEKAIQTAFREVADALAGRATLGDQLAAQQAQADAEPSASAWPTCATATGSPATWRCWTPSARCSLLQQALAQVRLAHWQNQVTLYKALGGGAAVPPA
jgi:hypothetical protein